MNSEGLLFLNFDLYYYKIIKYYIISKCITVTVFFFTSQAHLITFLVSLIKPKYVSYFH